ncbi:hypothetical protein LCGC14_2461360, partial [marine sediment metagenome]
MPLAKKVIEISSVRRDKKLL